LVRGPAPRLGVSRDGIRLARSEAGAARRRQSVFLREVCLEGAAFWGLQVLVLTRTWTPGVEPGSGVVAAGPFPRFPAYQPPGNRRTTVAQRLALRRTALLSTSTGAGGERFAGASAPISERRSSLVAFSLIWALCPRAMNDESSRVKFDVRYPSPRLTPAVTHRRSVAAARTTGRSASAWSRGRRAA
jgi:hypothetical protein